MENIHKVTLEAINHIIQNDPIVAKSNQELALSQIGINSGDIGMLIKAYEKLFKRSKSQFRQDVFVLLELNFKKDGFFVEFGASHGGEGSNTWLLEEDFGWKGVLAEPSKCFHDELHKNRKVHIEKKCVWKSSGEVLLFNEVTLPGLSGLSTIDSYSNSDGHAHLRNEGNRYAVETISLTDLLDKYNAPHYIDYLSIDTEGTELEILSHHDFEKYKFKIITCEHNYTDAREKIYSLLTSKGYIRKFTDVSLVDDWYVLEE